MDIEQAFNILTGDTDNHDTGKIRGTTKAEVKAFCGTDWDEKAWQRMVNSKRRKRLAEITASVPHYIDGMWYWH